MVSEKMNKWWVFLLVYRYIHEYIYQSKASDFCWTTNLVAEHVCLPYVS